VSVSFSQVLSSLVFICEYLNSMCCLEKIAGKIFPLANHPSRGRFSGLSPPYAARHLAKRKRKHSDTDREDFALQSLPCSCTVTGNVYEMRATSRVSLRGASFATSRDVICTQSRLTRSRIKAGSRGRAASLNSHVYATEVSRAIAIRSVKADPRRADVSCLN
jgi:hypothetical protein